MDVCYALAAYVANISYIIVVFVFFVDESLIDRELQMDKSWDFQKKLEQCNNNPPLISNPREQNFRGGKLILDEFQSPLFAWEFSALFLAHMTLKLIWPKDDTEYMT